MPITIFRLKFSKWHSIGALFFNNNNYYISTILPFDATFNKRTAHHFNLQGVIGFLFFKLQGVVGIHWHLIAKTHVPNKRHGLATPAITVKGI